MDYQRCILAGYNLIVCLPRCENPICLWARIYFNTNYTASPNEDSYTCLIVRMREKAHAETPTKMCLYSTGAQYLSSGQLNEAHHA